MSCLRRCFGPRQILTSMSASAVLQTHMFGTSYAKENYIKSSQKMTLYKRLQLSPSASADEIKSAYRQLALQWHPDVVENERRVEAEVKFRGISEAYEVLSDSVKRRAYDTSIGISQRAEKAKSQPSEQQQQQHMSRSASSPEQTATSWSSSFTSHNKRRKPFVRGDANRTFAKVFEGKTLEQILFEAQRRQRERCKQDRQSHTSFAQHDTHTAKQKAKVNTTKESRQNDHDTKSTKSEEELRNTSAQATNSNGKESNTSEFQDAKDTYTTDGYDASMERVLDHAVRTFASRAQRQYGPGILKHIKLMRKNNIYAKPPPDTFMPFRPFVNTQVPDGVQTIADPVMGPLEHVNDDKLDSTLINYDVSEFDQSDERRTQNKVNIVIDKLEDGTPEPRNETLTKIRKRVHYLAHNAGQLYSYQRPY